MVSLDIAETRLPQDGKCHLNVSGREVDVRVSTLPTIFGEKVVLRLLERNNISRTLGDLGMEERQLTEYRKVLSRPQGLVLVTGPTGSGKTTTLYASLNEVNSLEKNIVTIEDPVEYQLQGVTQVNVNYKTGLTFEKGLRAVLRQDPDIIMVGEIRDRETARTAMQAAMTGHLVFSTLHTSSAAQAIERLSDMGVETFLSSASLSCVVSQRLLRLACPKCKECRFTGYMGRTGVYEMIFLNDDIRKMIMNRASKKDIENAADLRTIYESAVEKTQKGLTDMPELARVITRD
jgi:type IV pilus assembly protein PilB